MEMDERVRLRYDMTDEDSRLRTPGRGELIRLRSWDILDRFVIGRRVADIGGGPGTHAEYLARRGLEVLLVDPVARHVEQAQQRARAVPFEVQVGDARRLPLADSSFDTVLLMGPLYHLTEADERHQALAEAARILRPRGRLIAEVITRHAWVLDATSRGLLDDEAIWETFGVNVERGLSIDPKALRLGGFWAYFHRVDEVPAELATAGFHTETMLGVEGSAWLLQDLEGRMKHPEPLLRAMRLIEDEPALLGVSAHLMVVANSAASD